MKRILGIAFAAGLSAGPALAADMAVKAPRVAVAPAPVYTWTGCYIGANGGGLWAHKRWTDGVPGIRGGNVTTVDHTASGGMGGGQIGCDYQTGRWVFGIEGSYDAVSASATSPIALTTLAGTTNVKGLGEVGGRVGYTVIDQALLYIRGGVAFERDRYNISTQVANILLATASETRTGGFVGVGFEYLFTQNVSAFIEYDYVDMGTHNVSFTSTAVPVTFTTQSIRERKDVVKVGLNYRFNWAQPVVAKY